MNNGTILEFLKKSDLVGPDYTPEMGLVSWPRLKEFAELVEARTLAEARSAAPELLVALERLLWAYDRLKPLKSLVSDPEKQAQAAIAKARGEA